MEVKQAGKKGVTELVKRMELGLVPEEEIRRLMRIQIRKRLEWGYKPTHEEQLPHLTKFIQSKTASYVTDKTGQIVSYAAEKAQEAKEIV